jgi:hypothetical protein
MEPISVTPVTAADGLAIFEPVTKRERELIVGYRRLSSDDQERLLLVLHALVSVKPVQKSQGHVC